MTTEFDDIVMRGSQQRDYGYLVGSCQIYLDRFAIVLGSETESPSTATSVISGSDLSFYQCGFEYAGNFSLLYFLSLTASLPVAAFEVRICRNDNKRIVIETYGDVATTQAMSLWFNTAKSAHKESSEPNWVKLNSVAVSSTMAYATTSYVFKEDISENNGSTLIDCCKKCPTCQCLNCYICDRIYLKAVGSETKIYGTSIKHGYGKNLGNSACVFKVSNGINKYNLYFLDDDGETEHLIIIFEWETSTANYDIIAEYKIKCSTVTIWSYLDDDVIIDLDDSSAENPVTTSTFDFDYLKNCTTTVLSFTGCISFVVFSPVPLISDLWMPEKNISFAQTITSTPDNKCFPGSVSAEDYEDFTWEIFATTETPVNTMIGKDPTIEFYEDVYYKEQNDIYEVSVKTGDIYLLDQKYLKSSNSSCISVSHNIIAPNSYQSRGCEFNGKAWFPSYNSTTHQAGILNIEPSDTLTDLEIDGTYYKYGFIPCLSGYHTTMAVHNGNLYALDAYGIKLIASDGSYTTLGNPGGVTEISLVDGHLFTLDKSGWGVSGTVATPDGLPPSGYNYFNVASTNTLWYHSGDIAEYNGWRNSGLPPQSFGNMFQIYDLNWNYLPQYNLFPRIPYLAHGSNYHKIEYNGELFCFDMNYNDGDISPRIAKAMSYPTIYSGQGTYLGDIYRPSTNWYSTRFLYVHDNVLYILSGYDNIGQLLMYDGSSTLTPIGKQYPACVPVICSYNGKLLVMIPPTSEKPINIISLL